MQDWRTRWGAWFLNRFLSNSQAMPAVPVGKAGQQALIAFDAADPAVEAIRETVVATLRKRGYQVECVGYFDDKTDHPEAGFTHFNRKSLDWRGRPTGELIEEWIKRPRALVLGLHRHTCLPVSWLVALTSAVLRIGLSGEPCIYHLVLEGHEQDLRGVAPHLERMLDTMKTREYAHT